VTTGERPARAPVSTDNAIVVQSLVVEHATPAGTIRALDRVSFTVTGGSSVAVTGPSGGGKSTLLGVVGGLARPTTGTVTVGDRDLSSLQERDGDVFRRRSIGFVYQTDNLLPFLTVLENVQLRLALVGEGVDPVRPLDLLGRLGLADLAHRLPDQLSGGQRQRAAVARAVVHRPLVILADEPTGALDAESGDAVIELLLDIRAELGATLVMVTHDLSAASRLDHRLVLADGRLV
jgi:putative ABC transport system ATP-binding protein